MGIVVNEEELNDHPINDPSVVKAFLPGLSDLVIKHAIKEGLFRYNSKTGYYVDSLVQLGILIKKDAAGELEEIFE